jgi:hypothetical protein
MRLTLTSAVAAGLVVAADAAGALEYKFGPITIVHPCARATPARVGGTYMTLRNSGSTSDRLIGASSPEAEKAETHETKVESGMAMMRAVGAVELKPGATVELKPGGLHLMLLGLKRPLKEGETLKLTLVFEKAGAVEIEAVIEKAGSSCGHK